MSGAAGMLRQLMRPAVLSKFAATGVLVGGGHLLLVSLAVLAGVPIQLALAVSFAIALGMHFALNRQWVFASQDGYALRFSRQGLRYLAVAATSYAGTSISVAVLPDILGVHELVALFLAMGAMACFTFAALNLWVFRTDAETRVSS